MGKINAINNASKELTIDPGASGDSFVQFDINGTGEFRIGVDDDDSDKFKISQGSALGANDIFVVEATGEILLPLNPAVLAINSSTDLNVTGDGSTVTCDLDSEIFDQGGNFSADTFTAPVTGKYLISTSPRVGGLLSGHTSGYTILSTSNRDYFGDQSNPYAIAFNSGGTLYSSLSTCCVVDMDASDTAVLKINVGGSTKVVDVFGTGTNATTRIMISLVC